MGHGIAAWLHVRGLDLLHRQARQRGQGTVEYVGMVVMVTLLVAAVAVAAKGWAPDVGGGLKRALVNAMKKLTDGFE
jgi:hypothetical protein